MLLQAIIIYCRNTLLKQGILPGFLLLILLLTSNNCLSQSVTNPSNTPGYDSTKATTTLPSAAGVMLTTDSADYQPGTTAQFYGSGFLPNETVTLQVSLLGNPPGVGSAYNPFNVVADNNGAFTAYWYVDSQNLGRQLQVTAYGQTSGYTSLALFTDATPSNSCYFAPDNTYTSFPANDDGSIGPINLGFSFNFYGTTYTQCYINNNGNITFGSAQGNYTSTGFPNTTPMIAPFWADVDTRGIGSGIVQYKVSSGKIVITWPGVGYYANSVDKLNTFQVILTDGNDASIGLGNNVAFYYNDMQWTTGSASGGAGGFGGTAATVGINKGDGTNYVQVGRFSLNSSVYDGGAGADDGVNYLDYECFRFNVSNITNIPPSVSGVPSGNAITIPCGTTQTLQLTFLPPEVNQSVSTTVNSGSMCNVTTSTTNGSTSIATVNITGAACNMGTNNITFTATDNFNPAASTIVTVAVTVTAPTITTSSNSPVCAGSTLNLGAATTASGASFSWTGPNGFTSTSQSPSISNVTAAAAGTYTVTVTTASGCSGTAIVNVTVNSLPTVAAITGTTTTFYSGTTTLSSATSGGIWSSGSTGIATISSGGVVTAVSAGSAIITYTVTSSGCSSSQTATVVINPKSNG